MIGSNSCRLGVWIAVLYPIGPNGRAWGRPGYGLTPSSDLTLNEGLGGTSFPSPRFRKAPGKRTLAQVFTEINGTLNTANVTSVSAGWPHMSVLWLAASV